MCDCAFVCYASLCSLVYTIPHSLSQDAMDHQNGLISHNKRSLTNTASSSSLCSLPTFHRNQVPSVYKEPFIISGYRKPNSSLSECLCYAFVCHNDVWNFWSHFIPLLGWVSLLYYLSHHYDFSDSFYHPLLCFWIGGSCYALFSSVAHMFGCMSATVRSICFMVDYLGISIYVSGAGIFSYHHQLPLSSSIYDYVFPALCLHSLLCAVSTIFSSLSRFFWLKHRYVIRAVAFAPGVLSALSPFLLRLTVCVSTGEDCIRPTIHLHCISTAFIGLQALFFVSKIPERFSPGKFDVCFQSHTLFHICSACMTSVQMYMFCIDSEIRKTDLVSKVSPTFQTVFLQFLAVIVTGVIVVSVLSLLVIRGVLVPNKVAPVPPSHQKQE